MARPIPDMPRAFYRRYRYNAFSSVLSDHRMDVKTRLEDFALFGGSPCSIRSVPFQTSSGRILRNSSPTRGCSSKTSVIRAEDGWNNCRSAPGRISTSDTAFHSAADSGASTGHAGLALKGRTEVVMPSLTYRRLADIVAWAALPPFLRG